MQQIIEVSDAYRHWYAQPYVQHELVRQLSHKYLSVRKAINGKTKLVRYYTAYSVNLLQQCFRHMQIDNAPFKKLYFDLAVWKEGTPFFSFDIKTKTEQKKDFTDNEKWKDFFIGYDWCMDIDSRGAWTSAYNNAKKVKALLDEYNFPYSVKWSGGRGFHFYTPFSYFSFLKRRPLKYVDLCANICSSIAETYRLKCVDESIYDARRILKLAYSLDTINGSLSVALPLSNEQFYNFRPEVVMLENIMHRHEYFVMMFKRGLLMQNAHAEAKVLNKNIRRMVKDYGKKNS